MSAAALASTTETRDGRAWVVRHQYPGKKALYFGTVFAPREAKEFEVERLARETMAEYLPEGFQIIGLEPGALVFLPEQQARRAA